MKDVSCYLDQTYENLLWITTKTKAFVIDLSFTDMSLHWPKLQSSPKNTHCLLLSQFDETYPFVFKDSESG